MMKQLLRSFLLTVVLFAPILPVHAAGSATMSLDQSTYTVTRGESFDVTVRVDPNGESLDTVRAVVTFDPTVVTTAGVRLSGSFDRVAPGNYYDNENGKISWGAFTLGGPVTTSSSIITISFLGIAQGEGDIQISSDSRAINDGEERINTGALGEATVEVAEAPEAQPGVALLVVESRSHENEEAWYSNKSVELSWTELEGDSPMSAYYYSFGLESNASPSTYLSAKTTTLEIEAPTDGQYYFHLKGVQKDGQETSVVKRVVRVDATAPNPINLSVQDNKILAGESAWFLFATTDETSGVVEYQVAINSSEFQVQTSPLEIEDLPEGTYFFQVSALDRAGNSSQGGVSVRVYPQGTDLSRPDGYDESGEIQALTTAQEEIVEPEDGNQTLLITLILGIVAGVAIIYAVRKKKNN